MKNCRQMIVELNGCVDEWKNERMGERVNGQVLPSTSAHTYSSAPLFTFSHLLPLLLLLLTACASAQPTPQPASPTVTRIPTATASAAPAAPTTTETYPAPTAPPVQSAYPAPTAETDATIPVFTYEIVNTYPHDPDAFTQGLVYDAGGFLYEGTGLRGESSLRKVDLETGEVLQIHRLADQYFGEGIAVYDGRIAQLTWQSNVGFVYDKNSFEQTSEFEYSTEGWGLTHDGDRLIMSDGTATLHFLDPLTFEERGRVNVHDASGPITRLNELEYIDGEVYANVWQTDRIARINPETGQVTAWIDLTGLLPQEERAQLDRVDVLNGIAYDAANDRLFVTGKWWPTLFEIKLVPAES